VNGEKGVADEEKSPGNQSRALNNCPGVWKIEGHKEFISGTAVLRVRVRTRCPRARVVSIFAFRPVFQDFRASASLDASLGPGRLRVLEYC
jgi:hypothetical protein